MPIHFGVEVRAGKRGLKLTRDKYAVVSNKRSFPSFSETSPELWPDDWCEKHLANSLRNFDLNMEYFAALDRVRFNREIETFLEASCGFSERFGEDYQPFVEVFDLNDYDEIPGYYLMILDEYKQVYIGKTNDIKKRVRLHWSTSPAFDRLLFPIKGVETSKLSINSFRAFDTTRIYAQATSDVWWEIDWNEDYEKEYLSLFSNEFTCNRVQGGSLTIVDTLMMLDAKEEDGVMKSRKLGNA